MNSRERHKLTPAVFVAVRNKEHEILLLRRANTGYMDGKYDVPSGHLEAGELPHVAAARELEEEAGISLSPDDLELFQVFIDENEPANPYIGLFYRTADFNGEYHNAESHKHDHIEFFPVDSLPHVTHQVRDAIDNIATLQITNVYYAPGSMD